MAGGGATPLLREPFVQIQIIISVAPSLERFPPANNGLGNYGVVAPTMKAGTLGPLASEIFYL